MIGFFLFLAILITGVSVVAAIMFYRDLKEVRVWHDKHQMELTVEKDKTARLDEQLKTTVIQLDEVLRERVAAAEEIDKLNNKYDKLFHQKKSSEVRVGKIGENLAPFLNGWPYDPNTFRFIGNPVDGIQFADDKIRFVEIKTGKARLSASQKWIKDLVTQGKVSFVTFRIGEDGCTLIEDEMEI